MNTVKRWLAGFLSFAMIFSSSAFMNVGAFAAVVNHEHEDAKLADSQVVATITDNEGLAAQTTYRYASLQDAFNDAEDGDVIVLKKDSVEAINVNCGDGSNSKPYKNITLDLNKKSINSLKVADEGTTALQYSGVTIKGSGTVEGALSGNITLDGAANACPTVKTTPVGAVKVKWGIFETVDPSNFVVPGQGIYVGRTTSGKPTYEVGTVKPNWDWDSDGQHVNFNLVLTGTNKKLLLNDLTIKGNDTVGEASATCVETGYKYHTAKVTFKDSESPAGQYDQYTDKYGNTTQALTWAAGCTIKTEAGQADDLPFETLTKADRFIVEDNTEAVKNHDYDVKKTEGDEGTNKEEWTYGPQFEELNGVAIEDDDENPVYATILECKRNGCSTDYKNHELIVEGAISLTKGKTVTYTTDNGTYQTKTTEVKMYRDNGARPGFYDAPNAQGENGDTEVDCSNTGDFYRLTFDILDGDDNVLITGLTINYFTPIAKGTHNYSYVKDAVSFPEASGYANNHNVKTFWVFEKNGKEIEIPATLAELTYASTEGKELIDYAKENGDKLEARTYAYCIGCGIEKKLVDTQTIKAETAKPAGVKGETSGSNTYYPVTDGQYRFDDSFTFDYTDVATKTTGSFTLESKLAKLATPAGDPETAIYNNQYDGGNNMDAHSGDEVLFAAGVFDINDSNIASKSIVLPATEFTEGIVKFQFKSNIIPFVDLNRDGKKSANTGDNEDPIIPGTSGAFYQILPVTTTEHTWTRVNKVNGTVTAIDADAVSHNFDDEHFAGRQATATLDGYDGFDLYYSVYKDANGADAYQYAFVYGKDTPNGEPDLTTGRITVNGGIVIDSTKTDDNSYSNVWIYGENGAEGNVRQAKRWVYVPVQEDKVDVAAVSTTPTVGILGVAYKAQYDDNGVMKDATADQIVVFYRPDTTPNGTGWVNAKGENFGNSFPTDGRQTVPAFYAVVKDNPEDVDCDGFVKYTGLNDGIPLNFASDTYVFTSVEPGQKHSSITGTVTWNSEGSATVKLVCDKCKKSPGVDTTNNLKITRAQVVEPTCLEDGYTEYTATYRGFFENVTLVNDTYKGSVVKAEGHEVDPTSKLLVTKDGDTYKGQVYCTACEEYHDDVVSIEGPTVENDKSRTIKVNYTNGLKQYDEKGVKNDNYKDWKNAGLTQTLTLIDGVEPELNITGSAGEYTAVYGELTDYGIANAFDELELENGDVLTVNSIYDKSEKTLYQSVSSADAGYDQKAIPLSVVVTDADGNVVKAPRREADGKALPVGTYTMTITGLQTGLTSVEDNSTFNYTGTIVKTITVVDDADADYVLNDLVDGDNKGAVSDETVAYDGAAHTYKVVAYVPGGADYNNVDKDVTISYKLEGKDATEADLSFTEAGTYDIEITATKANFQPQTKKVKFTIATAKVEAAIDNAEMVEGAEPNVRYTLKRTDGSKTPIDEKAMGFKIVSSGGDDLTTLKPGKYAIKGIATNKNYDVTTVGYGSTGTAAPQIEVFAKDSSTAQERALADAASKKINDLTDESSAADVAAARKAYDALSPAAKARVDSATLAKLVAQEDRIAAEAVIDQLNKATTDDQKAAAYDAYNKLSANAKAKVDADAAAKAKLADAKKAYDNKAAAPVIANLTKINANSSEADAKAALDAYNKLTADQKSLVTANAAAKAGLDAASKIVNKKTDKIKKFSPTKKKFKAKDLKKGSKKFKVTAKANSKLKVTIKKAGGSKKLSFKKGKVVVKKGTKKGSYKIKLKLTTKGNATYKPLNTTKTIKVTVK